MEHLSLDLSGDQDPVNLPNLLSSVPVRGLSQRECGAWPCGQDSGFILALVEYVDELEQSPFAFLCSVSSSVMWGLAASTLQDCCEELKQFLTRS